MEFSSQHRSLRWAYKPPRRFLQNSSLCTRYLNRLESVEMIFGFPSLVLRISQSQIPIAEKFVLAHLHSGDLRVGIQHAGLVRRHVGRSNTDHPKYSRGTTYYRNIHSIRSFVQFAITSNRIAACTTPWFSPHAFPQRPFAPAF